MGWGGEGFRAGEALRVESKEKGSNRGNTHNYILSSPYLFYHDSSQPRFFTVKLLLGIISACTNAVRLLHDMTRLYR